MGHHGEVGIHAAVPAAVALDAAAGVEILDVVALAGGADEGTGAACQTGLVKCLPQGGVEILLSGLSTPFPEAQVFLRQPLADGADTGLFLLHRFLAAAFQEASQPGSEGGSLVALGQPVEVFIGEPGGHVPLRGGAVDAEGSTEAGAIRPSAGQAHNGAHLPPGSIEAVHRVGQKHPVQYRHGPHVAGPHAKHHKGGIPVLFRGDGELPGVACAGVQVLALGEEYILGGLDGFQRVQVGGAFRRPQGEIRLSGSLDRQKQVIFGGNGGTEGGKLFFRNSIHSVTPSPRPARRRRCGSWSGEPCPPGQPRPDSRRRAC